MRAPSSEQSSVWFEHDALRGSLIQIRMLPRSAVWTSMGWCWAGERSQQPAVGSNEIPANTHRTPRARE